MSGKVQKELRKLARAELKKRMQPNSQPLPPRQQINIIAELEQYVMSCQLLTGEKPASITLVEPMYNLYIQESQRHAEVLGLKPGYQNEEPTFNGVRLFKKSPFIAPPASPPIN